MRLLTAVSGVRVPQQAPSSPQGELRNNSPFLGELFACMPAAPLRVAKMQDVRCAPRSCGTIAPLSYFCSAGRLRRGFFFLLIFFLSLEPPDAVFALHDSRVQISWRKLAIPSRLALLTGVRVPLGVPAESIFGGVVSGAGKHLISRCFFSPCLGT